VAERDELRASEYLVELYNESHARWEAFRASQKPADLSETASLLCAGLGGLQEDQVFWSAMIHFVLERGEYAYHEEVAASMSNLDRLLGIEEDLLAERFGRRRARALVADLANAATIFRKVPDGYSLENLRARLGGLRDATCEAAEATLVRPTPFPDGRLRTWRETFYRSVRVVRRAVLFAGGGALVVVNLTAESQGLPDVFGSVMTGAGLMFQQVEEK
jgi:hypothetical protein